MYSYVLLTITLSSPRRHTHANTLSLTLVTLILSLSPDSHMQIHSYTQEHTPHSSNLELVWSVVSFQGSVPTDMNKTVNVCN